MQTRAARPRVPGLDGVRAIAVLVVMGFHLGAPALSGGFLGVDVFFVLSGFLITDLLIAQRPSLKDFWTRRARRLLPALAVMLIVVTAAATIIEPEGGGELRPALLAAVTYTSNWYQMLHHVPYFDTFGPLPPLQHLWSLAIEEQFYLLWPLLLFFLMRSHNVRFVRLGVTLLGAVGSAVVMGLTYHLGDPSAVYYGTHTHASGLLIGAALAMVFPLSTLADSTEAMTQRLDAAGLAGLAVLAWAFGHYSGDNPSVYPYGMVIAAVAAATVIAAATAKGLVAALLSVPPLRWIGIRSYAMYLWHWPVIALTSKLAHGNGNPLLWVAETACTVTLAAVSWRFIESPILQDGFRMTVRTWARQLTRTISRTAGGAERIIPAAITAGALAVVAVAGYGIIGPLRPATETGLLVQVAQGEHISASSQRLDPSTGQASPAAGRGSASVPRPRAQHATVCHQSARINGHDVTAVGDSVMLASASALWSDMPGIYMDAKVSRQMYTGVHIVQGLAASGSLRHYVVVALGTNGTVTPGEVWQLRLAAGAGRELILVNVYGPMPWTHEVNSTLSQSTWHKPHVLLADWAATISGHTNLLWSDGIHPQPSGATVYAKLVLNTIRASCGRL